MAKHVSDPEGAFMDKYKYICRATEAINLSWFERISFIAALKENALISDEYASLYVLNSFMGSSFSVENWYKLTPAGVIKEYEIHPFREGSSEASWRDDD